MENLLKAQTVNFTRCPSGWKNLDRRERASQGVRKLCHNRPGKAKFVFVAIASVSAIALIIYGRVVAGMDKKAAA